LGGARPRIWVPLAWKNFRKFCVKGGQSPHRTGWESDLGLAKFPTKEGPFLTSRSGPDQPVRRSVKKIPSGKRWRVVSPGLGPSFCLGRQIQNQCPACPAVCPNSNCQVQPCFWQRPFFFFRMDGGPRRSFENNMHALGCFGGRFLLLGPPFGFGPSHQIAAERGNGCAQTLWALWGRQAARSAAERRWRSGPNACICWLWRWSKNQPFSERRLFDFLQRWPK